MGGGRVVYYRPRQHVTMKRSDRTSPLMTKYETWLYKKMMILKYMIYNTQQVDIVVPLILVLVSFCLPS